jgi:hypothetical protein
MSLNRFRNHFQFALRKEASQIRREIPINRVEEFGNLLSWFIYEFRKMAARFLCDPRNITIFFTLFFMALTSLLFYPSITWRIIEQTFTSITGHIEWKYVRFGLWLISEITILGLGVRAFGRFSNAQLMKFHGIT